MKRRSSEDAADADASETPSAGKRARATTATIAENPTGDDDVRGDARDARDLTRRDATKRRDGRRTATRARDERATTTTVGNASRRIARERRRERRV
jgi:hypothetical protein